MGKVNFSRHSTHFFYWIYPFFVVHINMIQTVFIFGLALGCAITFSWLNIFKNSRFCTLCIIHNISRIQVDICTMIHLGNMSGDKNVIVSNYSYRYSLLLAYSFNLQFAQPNAKPKIKTVCTPKQCSQEAP